MRLPRIALLAAVPAAALLTAPAGAQVTVYNNFVGPGHNGWDYNWGLGWTVAGVNVPAQYGVEQALLFYPSTGGLVSDVWVAMWYVPLDPGVDSVYLRLTRNPSMQPPRPQDVMEEWIITDFESWTEWREPKHVKGGGTSFLDKGASYWLWAAGGDTTWCGWCHNKNPALTCPHTLRREGQGWLPIANETASAFRVDVWLRGDLNCDSVVNNFDIDPFVLALTDPAGYQAAFPNCFRMLADCNGDGVVDNFDIDPFVDLLTVE